MPSGYMLTSAAKLAHVVLTQLGSGDPLMHQLALYHENGSILPKWDIWSG